VVIVQHYPDSAKHCAEAIPFAGRLFALSGRYPHPDCQAADALIRWGTYERQARTGLEVYHIRVQRIRCQGLRELICYPPSGVSATTCTSSCSAGDRRHVRPSWMQGPMPSAARWSRRNGCWQLSHPPSTLVAGETEP
jgi:hypothetical protein